MLEAHLLFRRLTGAAAIVWVAVVSLAWRMPAIAGSQFYRYDTLGRLNRSCTALNITGERTDYNLDARDNRSSYVNSETDIWLPAGSGLTSPDGRFTLWMQYDGNLVLYQNSNAQALWASGTTGTGADLARFQSWGNIVVYGGGQAKWETPTYSPCAWLAVQSDGNLVIYNSDNQPLWASNTGGR